jgi:sulfate transport system permease protein
MLEAETRPVPLPAGEKAIASKGVASAVAYTEPLAVKVLLIGIATAFLGLMVIVPVANIFSEAFSKGFAHYVDALKDEDTISALNLTLKTAAVVVPLNALFGVAAAWSITKFEFPGKSLLVTLIDLPLAVSPVVAGLIFLLIFGQQGYLGPWLRENGFPQIVFAFPGIAIATAFVTFPLVARTLIPVMDEAGREFEEAAISLGASGLQAFRHVTLPSVKWGLLYGVILCNARAMGEFGAVAVISGKITGKTDTLPLRIEKLDKAYDTESAFAIASLLVGLALVTLLMRTVVEWRTERRPVQEAALPQEILK